MQMQINCILSTTFNFVFNFVVKFFFNCTVRFYSTYIWNQKFDSIRISVLCNIMKFEKINNIKNVKNVYLE